MRPLKPMVGVVKSLGYYRRGPVGLVRMQNLQLLKKEKTHLSELPHPAPKGSLPSVIESA
jgi:hypothetical protein